MVGTCVQVEGHFVASTSVCHNWGEGFGFDGSEIAVYRPADLGNGCFQRRVSITGWVRGRQTNIQQAGR